MHCNARRRPESAHLKDKAPVRYVFRFHDCPFSRGFTTALNARFAPFSVSSAPAALAASRKRLDCSGSSGAGLVCAGLVTGLEALIREFLPQHFEQIHRLNAEGPASSHNFTACALSVSFLTNNAG